MKPSGVRKGFLSACQLRVQAVWWSSSLRESGNAGGSGQSKETSCTECPLEELRTLLKMRKVLSPLPSAFYKVFYLEKFQTYT